MWLPILDYGDSRFHARMRRTCQGKVCRRRPPACQARITEPSNRLSHHPVMLKCQIVAGALVVLSRRDVARKIAASVAEKRVDRCAHASERMLGAARWCSQKFFVIAIEMPWRAVSGSRRWHMAGRPLPFRPTADTETRACHLGHAT